MHKLVFKFKYLQGAGVGKKMGLGLYTILNMYLNEEHWFYNKLLYEIFKYII